MLRGNDFGGLLETHGTTGTVETAILPRNYKFFWAHGTSQQAGVGLVLKDEFLGSFNPVLDSDWRTLVPGGVGRLQLRGVKGVLDFYVLYLASGSEAAQERSHAMHVIANSM